MQPAPPSHDAAPPSRRESARKAELMNSYPRFVRRPKLQSASKDADNTRIRASSTMGAGLTALPHSRQRRSSEPSRARPVSSRVRRLLVYCDPMLDRPHTAATSVTATSGVSTDSNDSVTLLRSATASSSDRGESSLPAMPSHFPLPGRMGIDIDMQKEVRSLCTKLSLVAPRLLGKAPRHSFDNAPLGEGDDHWRGVVTAELRRHTECISTLTCLRASLVEIIDEASRITAIRLASAQRYTTKVQRQQPIARSSVGHTQAFHKHNAFVPVELGMLLSPTSCVDGSLVAPGTGPMQEKASNALPGRDKRDATPSLTLPALMLEAEGVLRLTFAKARLAGAHALLEWLGEYSNQRGVSHQRVHAPAATRTTRTAIDDASSVPAAATAEELAEVVHCATRLLESWRSIARGKTVDIVGGFSVQAAIAPCLAASFFTHPSVMSASAAGTEPTSVIDAHFEVQWRRVLALCQELTAQPPIPICDLTKDVVQNSGIIMAEASSGLCSLDSSAAATTTAAECPAAQEQAVKELETEAATPAAEVEAEREETVVWARAKPDRQGPDRQAAERAQKGDRTIPIAEPAAAAQVDADSSANEAKAARFASTFARLERGVSEALNGTAGEVAQLLSCLSAMHTAARDAIAACGEAPPADDAVLSVVGLHARAFIECRNGLLSDNQFATNALTAKKHWRRRLEAIDGCTLRLHADLEAAQQDEAQWTVLHKAQSTQCDDLKACLATRNANVDELARKHRSFLDLRQRNLAKLLRTERQARAALHTATDTDWAVFASYLRAQDNVSSKVEESDGTLKLAPQPAEASSAATRTRRALELLAEALVALVPSLPNPRACDLHPGPTSSLSTLAAATRPASFNPVLDGPPPYSKRAAQLNQPSSPITAAGLQHRGGEVFSVRVRRQGSGPPLEGATQATQCTPRPRTLITCPPQRLMLPKESSTDGTSNFGAHFACSSSSNSNLRCDSTDSSSHRKSWQPTNVSVSARSSATIAGRPIGTPRNLPKPGDVLATASAAARVAATATTAIAGTAAEAAAAAPVGDRMSCGSRGAHALATLQEAIAKDASALVSALTRIDPEGIEESRLALLYPLISDPNLSSTALQRYSRAAALLCEWVRSADALGRGVTQMGGDEYWQDVSSAKSELDAAEAARADVASDFEQELKRETTLARRLERLGQVTCHLIESTLYWRLSV